MLGVPCPQLSLQKRMTVCSKCFIGIYCLVDKLRMRTCSDQGELNIYKLKTIFSQKRTTMESENFIIFLLFICIIIFIIIFIMRT
jgi:hypothetical protein